jgi:hypothetical protein
MSSWNNDSRTTLAWLKAQRPETRRAWQGQQDAAQPTLNAPAAKAKAAADAAKPAKPAIPAIPVRVIVNTLLD